MKMTHLKNQKDFLIGGQAVIEGVMMKGSQHYSVAVRKPNKKIITKIHSLNPVHKIWTPLGWPFIRGVANLFQMLTIGIKALNFSANQQLDQDDKKDELSTGSIVLTTVFSLFFALLLFKMLPLGITKYASTLVPGLQDTILFNMLDGFLRIAIFIGYIVAISFIPDIGRLFQYHGAEHKSIYCLEAKLPLTVANVRPFSPKHPRCGTSFLLLVLVLSILVFSLVPVKLNFFQLLLLRLPLVFPIAGISYEILKASAKYKHSLFFKFISTPGLWLQNLTTREPDDSQIQVAISSLKTLLKKEKRGTP